MYVYVIFSLNEWRRLRHNKEIKVEPEWSSECMHSYMLDAISKKSGVECIHPITAYYTKPAQWMYPRRRVICKVRIDNPDTQLVWYDDVLYVCLLNSFGNGRYEFMSTSEEEAERMNGASVEECMKSFDRIFDRSLQRDFKWIGRAQSRAFITRLTRDMIVKYQAYNGAVKLYKK